jgi:hypothetical protein
MGHMGKQGYEDWKELKRLQQVDRGENKTWSYKRSDTDGFKGNDSNYTAQQDTPYGAGGTVAMAVMNGIGTDPTRAGAAKSLQRGRDLTQVSKSELMAHQEEEKQKHLSRYTNSDCSGPAKDSFLQTPEECVDETSGDSRVFHSYTCIM